MAGIADIDNMTGPLGFNLKRYEEKWGPKQDLIDEARAEAEAQGLKYIGDASTWERLKEGIKQSPDMAANYALGSAAGISELLVGLGLATMKGAQMATTTDPERLEKLSKEPAFTKYMGEIREAMPTVDMVENKLSGISSEQFGETLGYYTGPPTAALALPGKIVGAAKAIKPEVMAVKKGTVTGKIPSAQRQKVYDEMVKGYKQDEEINAFLSEVNQYKREYKKGPGKGNVEQYFISKEKNLDDFLKKFEGFVTSGDDNLKTYLRTEMGDNYGQFWSMAKKRIGAVKKSSRDMAYSQIKTYLDDYVKEYKVANKGVTPSGKEFTQRQLVDWLLAKNNPAINKYFANIGNKPLALQKIIWDLRANKDLAKGFDPAAQVGGQFGATKVPGIYYAGKHVKNLSKSTQQKIGAFVGEVRETIPYEKTRSKNIRSDASSILDKHMDRVAYYMLEESHRKGTKLLNLEDELLTIVNKIDKNKLGELLQKRYKLQSKVEEARALGVDLDDLNLSHMEDVVDNWRVAFDVDNLFITWSKSNYPLQHNLNKSIKKIQERIKKAKTDVEKAKIAEEMEVIQKQLEDSGIITKVEGEKYGQLLDIEKKIDEPTIKLIGEATGLYKRGGMVGISQLTRPLRNFSS